MYGFEIPTDYEGLNAYNSMRSVAGRVQNDINTQFYMRALWQRAIAGTTFKLPKSWRRAKRYLGSAWVENPCRYLRSTHDIILYLTYSPVFLCLSRAQRRV